MTSIPIPAAIRLPGSLRLRGEISFFVHLFPFKCSGLTFHLSIQTKPNNKKQPTQGVNRPLVSAVLRLWRDIDLQSFSFCNASIMVTRLFESGLDLKEVQYLAGHATPTMTLRVYTHYIQESRFSQTAEKVKWALD